MNAVESMELTIGWILILEKFRKNVVSAGTNILELKLQIQESKSIEHIASPKKMAVSTLSVAKFKQKAEL